MEGFRTIAERTSRLGRMKQRAHAGDHAISEAEVGRPFPGAIENQQLLLDEHGFGHHGTRAAGTGEPGDGRQQMEKQDGQIAHGTILTRSRNPRNAQEFGIRHAQECGGGRSSLPRPAPIANRVFSRDRIIAGALCRH